MQRLSHKREERGRTWINRCHQNPEGRNFKKVLVELGWVHMSLNRMKGVKQKKVLHLFRKRLVGINANYVHLVIIVWPVSRSGLFRAFKTLNRYCLIAHH